MCVTSVVLVGGREPLSRSLDVTDRRARAKE
jgi:hypothetical protein